MCRYFSFSDEAYFWLNGYVTGQNYWIMGSKKLVVVKLLSGVVCGLMTFWVRVFFSKLWILNAISTFWHWNSFLISTTNTGSKMRGFSRMSFFTFNRRYSGLDQKSLWQSYHPKRLYEWHCDGLIFVSLKSWFIIPNFSYGVNISYI